MAKYRVINAEIQIKTLVSQGDNNWGFGDEQIIVGDRNFGTIWHAYAFVTKGYFDGDNNFHQTGFEVGFIHLIDGGEIDVPPGGELPSYPTPNMVFTLFDDASQTPQTWNPSQYGYHGAFRIPSAEVAIGDDATVFEGSGKIAVAVSIVEPSSAAPIKVTYSVVGGSAAAGEDFKPTSGTLTFSAFEGTKYVYIDLIDDNKHEGNETFSVVLSGLTGPSGVTTSFIRSATTITITDNDEAAVLFDATANTVNFNSLTTLQAQAVAAHVPLYQAGAGADIVTLPDIANASISGFAIGAIFRGEGGDDVINGGNGKDNIDGGDGRDQLSGGDNDDVLTGGANNDTLSGGAGYDVVQGEGGDDLIYGANERDKVDGGSGTDTLVLPSSLGSYEIGKLKSDLLIRTGDTAITIVGVEKLEIGGTTYDVSKLSQTQKAATIFADEGKIAFMATMAAASYRLLGAEPKGKGLNDVKPYADAAYAAVDNELLLLNAADLPSLKPKTVSGDFPFKGIRDGIYVNGNAAALVGRSSDALFISFRGTNDFAVFPKAGEGRSPDFYDWSHMKEHWQLFSPLISALKTYLSAEPGITQIFVTGHSLGAAMVQAFMANTLGLKAEAITFATPGYEIGGNSDDPRVTNFWTDNDIIQLPTYVQHLQGDQNNLQDGIFEPGPLNPVKYSSVDSHDMALYLAIARFLEAEDIDVEQIHPAKGVDYDNIVFIAKEASGGQYAVGDGNDRLLGTGKADLMLGGKGKDTLIGGNGQDYLRGGEGADRFVFRPKLDGKDIDVVADFKPGQDVLGLDNTYFKGIGGIGDLPAKLLLAAPGATAATDKNDRIIYDSTSGKLYFDADGKGGAAAVQFATLMGHPNLSADDFLIV